MLKQVIPLYQGYLNEEKNCWVWIDCIDCIDCTMTKKENIYIWIRLK
jgi:hypothetical protein